ncbi:nucleotidyltransferase domain-containing protein [Haloarcula argentinensis]|uniref:Polymerase nucleotidyl transferase domain-containing protein n=1 Tax=Haloarcula argentinensis TaxID=43776 RepID=A0A830FWL7_HALAR|nr:nucleotidyltransferase domain-containing protein [Haloarcula argentinensis]GGM49911.1 hypothetical protein GCM10009006_33990 [Haloarcula argentinensis]
MSDESLGPRDRRSLPSAREIAEEVYHIGEENDVPPSIVIVFGSYSNDEATPESDVDIVVVTPHVKGEGFYERRKHWGWDWDYQNYPTADLIILTPTEFDDYKSRREHIVSTAVSTGERFEF